MAASYQVWDQDSHNIVDEYDSFASLLRTLEEWRRADGPSALEGLVITREADGELTRIAAGPEVPVLLSSSDSSRSEVLAGPAESDSPL
jgi:hypothetical protein